MVPHIKHIIRSCWDNALIRGYSESDWAGYQETPKSASGGIRSRGAGGIVKHRLSTQKAIP